MQVFTKTGLSIYSSATTGCRRLNYQTSPQMLYPSSTAEHVCMHRRSEEREDESWSAALFIPLDPPPGGGGQTIVEIAKWKEIVQNMKRISQQWKDPLSQIPKPWTILEEMAITAFELYYTEEVLDLSFFGL